MCFGTGLRTQAEEILRAKSKCVLILPDLSGGSQAYSCSDCGFLGASLSSLYRGPQSMASGQRLTTHPPDQMEELLFAWKVAKR